MAPARPRGFLRRFGPPQVFSDVRGFSLPGASLRGFVRAAIPGLRVAWFVLCAFRRSPRRKKSAKNTKIADYVQRHGAELARTMETEPRVEFPLNGSLIRGAADVLPAEEDGVEIRDCKTDEGESPAGEAAAEREAAEIVEATLAGRVPPRPGRAWANCDFARIGRYRA